MISSLTQKGFFLRSALTGFCILIAGLSVSPAAETNAAPTRSSRYLFILDISSGMKKRSANTETAIAQLIASGMNGQMHRGDTVGFWLFNERLYAGMIPMQTWTPERRLQMASSVVTTLHDVPYGKKSQFANVLVALRPIVKSSERITVLLVSDGSPISGTPYDSEINTYFKDNADVQKDARMPFVTVLRAKDGEYLGHIVNAAPWPVEFPEFPPEPEVVEPPKPKIVEAPKPAPRPNLIVIGTKRETNVPPAMVLPQPQVMPPIPEPKAPPRTANEILAAEMLAQAQAQTSPASPAADAKVELPPPAPTPATVPEAVTTALAAAPEPSHATPTVKEVLPVVSTAPAPTTPPSAMPEVKPATAIQPPTLPNSPPVKPAEEAAPKSPTPPVPAAVAPMQVAVAAPTAASSLNVWLLVSGAALLGLALGVILMMLKRSRTAPRSSLITRSMDRDQE